MPQSFPSALPKRFDAVGEKGATAFGFHLRDELSDAIDRPLSAPYEWGDFRADPRELVAKYFDAFLYYANWATRRLMLRVPSAWLDLKITREYCATRASRTRGSSSVATVMTVGAHLVIDLWSEDESGEDWEGVEPSALSVLVPIRASKRQQENAVKCPIGSRSRVVRVLARRPAQEP